jgi:surfactin synthase thioesterase subunit
MMNKIKLFCFPFAGGSAAVFNKWRTLLDKNIEFNPIELAGRGRRIREPLYGSIDDAVADVFNIINTQIKNAPFAFYGHSMGTAIAFELTYKLREQNLPEPGHLFFSGRGAPHMPDDDKKKYHLMPDDEFKEEMIKLGGTAKEFFEHPELLEVFLPLLRNDLKINESYVYKEKPGKLNCSITILNGIRDEDVTSEEVAEWKIHTNRNCTFHNFPGDHFFINDESEKIVQIINNTLAPSYN